MVEDQEHALAHAPIHILKMVADPVQEALPNQVFAIKEVVQVRDCYNDLDSYEKVCLLSLPATCLLTYSVCFVFKAEN